VSHRASTRRASDVSYNSIDTSCKEHLFREIIRDQVLLVVGYSGSDFDICPEIGIVQPRKILWNFLNWDETNIPPNLKFLAEKCDIDVVTGDMRDFPFPGPSGL
jgi:hypothetical protein